MTWAYFYPTSPVSVDSKVILSAQANISKVRLYSQNLSSVFSPESARRRGILTERSNSDTTTDTDRCTAAEWVLINFRPCICLAKMHTQA